jgi:hypothetical protein
LRAWSRAIVGYKFGWDDWTLGIATVAVFAFLAIEVPNAYKGTGDHIWNLNPDNGPDLLKVGLIGLHAKPSPSLLTRTVLDLIYLENLLHRRSSLHKDLPRGLLPSDLP